MSLSSLLRISSSVGTEGTNQSWDVKVVQSLLNVYLRTGTEPRLLLVNGQVADDTIAAITLFQKDKVGMSSPDGRVDVGGETFRKLLDALAFTFVPASITEPSKGLLTWHAEGAEGGPYHSRKLHVPTSSSGLTIGRGYDCRDKTANKIQSDLTKKSIAAIYANRISKSSRLRGEAAEKFIIENDLLDFQLTPTQQLQLFELSYDEIATDVKRICDKPDTVSAYGSVDWEKLNAKIKDVLIDLRFRGDYTTSSRRRIQFSVADNDVEAFKKQINNLQNWPNVPADRRQRRINFLN